LRQTSGALRPNCGDRRRFAGFWRFVAVEKFSRSKGLSATGVEPPSLRDGFNCRMRQLCEVRQRALSMRCLRSVAKFECSEALAPELRFAHGSNINSSCESCGKLKANGCCAKCLAAESGQGSVVILAGAIVVIQPQRALSIFGFSWSGGSGTAILVDCTEFCRDTTGDYVRFAATKLVRQCNMSRWAKGGIS
jgi:hypothetical protein